MKSAYIARRPDGLYYSNGEWVEDWRQATMFSGGAATNALYEDHKVTLETVVLLSGPDEGHFW